MFVLTVALQQIYRDKIVRPIVRPFVGTVGDGCRIIHVPILQIFACIFFKRRGMMLQDWSSWSPNLNPIALQQSNQLAKLCTERPQLNPGSKMSGKHTIANDKTHH